MFRFVLSRPGQTGAVLFTVSVIILLPRAASATRDTLDIDEVWLIDRGALLTGKQVGFLDPLDRSAIRPGCLEGIDRAEIAPERQHEAFMIAAHHHAA